MGNLEGEHTSKGMIIKPSRERGCKLAKIQRGEVYSNQTQKGWEVKRKKEKRDGEGEEGERVTTMQKGMTRYYEGSGGR